MSQSFSIQKSVSVEVPIWRAYGCWRRAENFPQFMDTVLEVKQMGKNQICWVETIDEQEFQTLVEIDYSSDFPESNHWGSIHFEARARGTTEVRVMMECMPELGSPFWRE